MERADLCSAFLVIGHERECGCEYGLDSTPGNGVCSRPKAKHKIASLWREHSEAGGEEAFYVK